MHTNMFPLLPPTPRLLYEVSRGEAEVHVQPWAVSHSELLPWDKQTRTHSSWTKVCEKAISEFRICGQSGWSFPVCALTLCRWIRQTLTLITHLSSTLTLNHWKAVILFVPPFICRPSSPTASRSIYGVRASPVSSQVATHWVGGVQGSSIYAGPFPRQLTRALTSQGALTRQLYLTGSFWLLRKSLRAWTLNTWKPLLVNCPIKIDVHFK